MLSVRFLVNSGLFISSSILGESKHIHMDFQPCGGPVLPTPTLLSFVCVCVCVLEQEKGYDFFPSGEKHFQIYQLYKEELSFFPTGRNWKQVQ